MDPEALKTAQWTQAQEGLARAMGLSLITYGPAASIDLGAPLTAPSLDNPICQLLQNRYGQRAQCEAHCGRRVAETFANGRPSLFTCYAHLHAFTVPLLDENGQGVVLLGGKVFSSYNDFFAFRETVQPYGVDAQTLLTLIKDIQFRDRASIQSASGLVDTVCRPLARTLASRERQEAASTRLMTLLAIAAELNNQPDQAALFRLLLNTVGVLYNATTAMALAPHPDGKQLVYAEGFGVKREALKSYRAPLEQSLYQRVLHGRVPVFCDVAHELRQAGFPPDVTSVHLFPVGRHRTVLVVLDTPLSAEDVKLIAVFAELCAVSLENDRLKSQAADRRPGLAQLTDFMRTSAPVLAANDLFQLIVDRSTECVEAEQGSLLLFDRGTNELTIKAIKGLNPKIVEANRIRPGEGISGQVWADGRPLLVEDLEADARVRQAKRPRYKTRSFISLPLRTNGETIGVLNVADKASGDPFTTYDFDLLTSIATYTTVAIQRSEFYRRSEELKQISITDPLTGLLNRRYFQERLVEEFERYKRHKSAFSLIILDIDDFKKFNDAHGHVAGDEALTVTARAVRNSIRAIDVAARYGGEEFTVILPQTSKLAAKTMANRIGRAVARTPISTPASGTAYLTVSLGVASFPDDAKALDDLLRNADHALYEAKRHGKNQAVVYAPASTAGG